MRIGLTYDLRSEYLEAGYGEEETAEFDREDTVEAIERALVDLGHVPDRIGHGRRLTERLVAGDRWELVFNIAEGLAGAARESQVPAILDLYGVPYTFSDPLVLGVCLHKGLAKMVVEKAGVPTAAFFVVESLDPWHFEEIPLPNFVKPVAEGTSKGIGPESIVRRAEDLRPICASLLAKFRQPVLVESFLEGREFTVGVIGTGTHAEVIGSLEVVLRGGAEPGAYSYLNKKDFEARVEYRLVRADEDSEVHEAEAVALAAWRALGCRDAGRVDVRSDAHGHPHFIEANPLAGLNPEISDLPILAKKLGLEFRDLIGRIVDSARSRVSEVGRGRDSSRSLAKSDDARRGSS